MNILTFLTDELYRNFLLILNVAFCPFIFYALELSCGIRYSRKTTWLFGMLMAAVRHLAGHTLIEYLSAYHSGETWFPVACSAIYIGQFIMMYVYFRFFFLGDLVKLFLLEAAMELFILIRYYIYPIADIVLFHGRKTDVYYQKGYFLLTIISAIIIAIIMHYAKPYLIHYRGSDLRHPKLWTTVIILYFLLSLFSQNFYYSIKGDFYELLLIIIPFTALATFLIVLYLGEYHSILRRKRERMEAESRSLERHYIQVVDQTGQIRAVNLDMQRTIERLMERLVDEASKKPEDPVVSETGPDRSDEEKPDADPRREALVEGPGITHERDARLMAAHDYLHELRKQYEQLNEAKYCEDYEINTLLLLNEDKFKKASLKADFFFQGQIYDLNQNKEDLLSLMNLLLDYGYRLLTEEMFCGSAYKDAYKAAEGKGSSLSECSDIETETLPSCSFRVAQGENRLILSLKAVKKGLSCRKTWKGLPGMYKKDRHQLNRILRRYRGDLTSSSEKGHFQLIIVCNDPM